MAVFPKTHVCYVLGHQLFVTPWTVACQAPLSMGILMRETSDNLDWGTFYKTAGLSQDYYINSYVPKSAL